MYSFKGRIARVTSQIVYAACLCAPAFTNAATLEERAVYNVKILPASDPAQVGQCSAFAFGDISSGGGGCVGGFSDNTVAGPPALTDGDGVSGDGFAGIISIETAKSDASGNNTFTINSFQVDPYLGTPGGTFKTTMSPPDGALTGSGTLTSSGKMTLNLTGRVGVAQFFAATIGIQPWNIDDSIKAPLSGVVSGQYELLTTGSDSNYDPTNGNVNLTLTGRAIGDNAPAIPDGILDAVLVSAGNVGQGWDSFDGTPYSEAFNVQFELVSAKPVANNDTLTTSQGTNIVIDVSADLLGNDTHAQGDTLTFVSFTSPAQAGSSIVDNTAVDGTITYMPDPLISGTGIDSFTYTIEDSDGSADADTATVTINIAVGNAPVANDFSVSTDEDTPVTFDPTSNDTDADGDSLSYTSFDGTTVQGGSVVAATGNDLTYTPPADFNGSDEFDYTVTDNKGGTDSAKALITVNPVNDALTCTDVDLATDTDTALSVDVSADLLSTCSDIDGDTITLASTTQPVVVDSTLDDDGAGTLTYTPASEYTGKDSFDYTATDGTASVTQTANVDVGVLFGNFTMLEVKGNTFGGTNDVVFTWDGTTFNSNTTDAKGIATDTTFDIMTIASEKPQPFNGFPWYAHDIRVFMGPAVLKFDTTCTLADYAADIVDCNNPLDSKFGQTEQYLTMTLGPNQIGAHILFDWNTSTNIDVVNVWEQGEAWDNHGDAPPMNELFLGPAGTPPDPDTTWGLVSTDADGDGINGAPMVDGPFIGFNANFNDEPGSSGAELPPIDTEVSEDANPLGASSISFWAMLASLVPLLVSRRYALKGKGNQN